MKKIIIILWFSFFAQHLSGQSTIITPHQVNTVSFNQSIVITRLPSSVIWAIPNPTKGTLVFDLTNKILRMYNGKEWVKFKSYGSPIFPGSSLVFKENDLKSEEKPKMPSKL